MRKMPKCAAAMMPIVGLLLLAGCAQPGVENRFAREDFVPDGLLDGRISLGGFVLGSRLDPAAVAGVLPDSLVGDPVLQSAAWCPVLATELLVRQPGLDLWRYPAVADQMDPALLTEIHEITARGGLLRENQLGRTAAELPGSRYLLLGRIDRTDLSLRSQDFGADPTERNPSGLGKVSGEGREDSGRNVVSSYRLTVTATLELYDLSVRRSVWSASVVRHRDEFLDARNAAARPSIQVKKDPSTASGIRFEGAGGLVPDQDLLPVLEAACAALTEELLAPAGGNEIGDGQDPPRP